MRNKRILIIDDEPDIRHIANLSLTRIGKFDVVAAGSGEEGLSISGQEEFDIILLDVMMPDMDGVTVYEKLKYIEINKNTPVVFMTARAQENEKNRYLSIGASGVIAKPFDPMVLPEQVKKIMQRE